MGKVERLMVMNISSILRNRPFLLFSDWPLRFEWPRACCSGLSFQTRVTLRNLSLELTVGTEHTAPTIQPLRSDCSCARQLLLPSVVPRTINLWGQWSFGTVIGEKVHVCVHECVGIGMGVFEGKMQLFSNVSGISCYIYCGKWNLLVL